MTTLQEQFERDFPNKSVEEIDADEKYQDSNFTNYDLDLREYRKLKELNLSDNKITSINLSECRKLRGLDLGYNKLTSLDLSGCRNLKLSSLNENQLTSVNISECKELTFLHLGCNNLNSAEFLNNLPNPEKLELLAVHNNNIQPTDIEIFSKFVNLKTLEIGTLIWRFNPKQNKFYGSLKSYRNLIKLESICIKATDIDKGLEYLPMSLAQSTAKEAKREKKDHEIGKKNGYNKIECSPCNTDAKCKTIQNQLYSFNYDLEAWQLAHPELMLKSRPEYFTNSDSKEQWINALTNKIEQTEQWLQETKNNLPEGIKILLTQRESLEKQVQEERTISHDSLKALEPDYLKTNLENKQKEEEITQLKVENKITQLENQQAQQVEIAPWRTN